MREDSWWLILVSRGRVSVLLLFSILLVGLLSWNQIPRELEPEVTIPTILVQTTWPNASALDIEKLVTTPIEQEVKSLDELDYYTSTSSANISTVALYFLTGSDMNTNLQNTREALANINSELPSEIEDTPLIEKVSFSQTPILSFSLHGPLTLNQIKSAAEKIKDRIEKIDDIEEVNIYGDTETEVHLYFDPLELQARDLSFQQVLNTITQSHKDLPLGQVKSGGKIVEITTRGELEEIYDFIDLPVAQTEDGVVRLGDIAKVQQGSSYEIQTTEIFNAQGRSPSLLLEVLKSEQKSNIDQINDKIFATLEDLRSSEQIPAQLEWIVTLNKARDVNESLGVLLNNGWQTLALILLVMLVALGWREAAMTSLAIPFSLLFGISFLFFYGESFNTITLFALVLSVGLLVDIAIVMTEGMSAQLQDPKISAEKAASNTIMQFRWPLFTGLLTTIFAFLPMLWSISGISGQFISGLPITIMMVLIGAFFITVFLLPSLMALFIKYRQQEPKKHLINHWAQKEYLKFIKRYASRRWQGALWLLGSVLSLVFALGLLVFRQVDMELFPAGDSRTVVINVEFPTGTPIETVQGYVPLISDALSDWLAPIEAETKSTFEFSAEDLSPDSPQPWVEDIVFSLGSYSNALADVNSDSSVKENRLGIAFQLVAESERPYKSYDIAPILREVVDPVLPFYAQINLVEKRGGPTTGSPVNLRVQSSDLLRLDQLSDQMRKELEALPELREVDDSRAEEQITVEWNFDHPKLAYFGLNVSELGSLLRAAINDVKVMELRRGDEEVSVRARLAWPGVDDWGPLESVHWLEQVAIFLPVSGWTNLTEIMLAPELKSQYSSFDHRDGIRTVDVFAKMEGKNPPSVVAADLERIVKETVLYPGEEIIISGESEEGNRIMDEMIVSMAFSVILILLILVWQFNSFIQAGLTLSLIFFSLVGVILGFWLTGFSITFPTMIGLVSLAGIIVNDAIIVLDVFNRYLRQGISVLEACLKAGSDRLQPVFLTSITTVLGMLPLSLSDETWGGLGFAIIFGMSLSTVLTLILVPAFLVLIYGPEKKLDK